MDERTKHAFDAAAETSKQMLALATGVLALEITFSKDIVPATHHFAKVILGISWAFLLLSAAAGAATLMALTGTIGRSGPIGHQSIYERNVRAPAAAQVLFFLLGLLCSIVAGVFFA